MICDRVVRSLLMFYDFGLNNGNVLPDSDCSFPRGEFRKGSMALSEQR